jgi:hypothetical protein
MGLREPEVEDDETLEEETTDEAEDADVELTDNVGDPSVEINVEDLIVELESEGFNLHVNREYAAKRRLEELMEEKRARRELEDFEDYDI